jgi:hypothetical protein
VAEVTRLPLPYDGSEESLRAILAAEDEPPSDEDRQWAIAMAEGLAGDFVQRQMAQVGDELRALEPALLEAVENAQAALAGVEVVAKRIDALVAQHVAETDGPGGARHFDLYETAFEHFRTVSGAGAISSFLYELSEKLLDDPWLPS